MTPEQPTPNNNVNRVEQVSPELQSTSSMLNGIERMLGDVSASIGRMHDQASPAQRDKLNEADMGVYYASQSVGAARKSLDEVKPQHRETLAKDGKSQFEAAERGDPRSVKVQVDRQKQPAEKQQAAPKLSLDTDSKTGVNALENKASSSFEDATNNRQSVPSRDIGSEQVKNTQPKPELKPSPELGGGVDAAAHLKEKSADNTAARQENARLDAIASSMNQQAAPSTGQSMGQSRGVSQ